MSAEQARVWQSLVVLSVTIHQRICWWEVPDATCTACVVLGEIAEMAAISLDLAVAEESHQRLRESIAWG